tara:strand:+ start:97 stop:558 length:462 start_codon:yes stop_codon:yes gene_type:complete
MSARITEIEDIISFLLGGKAIFTLKSVRTGRHFTYKVSRAKSRNEGAANEPLRWFVNLLTGPDNTGDYTYIGLLEQGDRGCFRFRLTRASKLAQDAAPVAGFAWLMQQLVNENAAALEQVEFWHEGRCCRCGRRLTDPTSIETGIGPVCAGRS